VQEIVGKTGHPISIRGHYQDWKRVKQTSGSQRGYQEQIKAVASPRNHRYLQPVTVPVAGFLSVAVAAAPIHQIARE
jgi:hypothetical protein